MTGVVWASARRTKPSGVESQSAAPAKKSAAAIRRRRVIASGVGSCTGRGLLEVPVGVDDQVHRRTGGLVATNRQVARRAERDDGVVGPCLSRTVVDRRDEGQRPAGGIDTQVAEGC